MKDRYYFTFLMSSLLLCLCCFNSCQSPSTNMDVDAFSNIENEEVRAVLEKAIQRAGDLEQWQSKKTISFKKYVALYDSTGRTEQADWQEHYYEYEPMEKVTIAWEKDNKNYELLAENRATQRLIDGKKDSTANQQSLENTVLSSTFVISLPFKLLDDGVQLTYEGEQVFEDSLNVAVIKAVYNAAEHENHSNQDIWRFYFDSDDYKMLGYTVQHDDHISYVINETFTEKDGFLFPHLRKSYRVNEAGEKLFLRAAYEYKDYELTFLTLQSN